MSHAVIELYPRELAPVRDSAPEDTEFRELTSRWGLTKLQPNGSAASREQYLESRSMQPLSEEELAAWCEYLPTSYWSRRDPRLFGEETAVRMFADYQFHEGVPLPVLRRMDAIGHHFDILEIRTPEAHMSDPVLWGHVITSGGTKVYPLARWAESDANWISGIEDLKKILFARRGAIFGIQTTSFSDGLLGILLFGIVAALGVALLMMFLPFAPHGWTMIGIGFGIGSMLSVVEWFTQWRRVAALSQSDPQLARFV